MQPSASSSASGERSICASSGGYAPRSKDLAIVPIPLNVRPAIGDASEARRGAMPTSAGSGHMRRKVGRPAKKKKKGVQVKGV